MDKNLPVDNRRYHLNRAEPVVIRFPEWKIVFVALATLMFSAFLVFIAIMNDNDTNNLCWVLLSIILCVSGGAVIHMLTFEIRADETEIRRTGCCCGRSVIETTEVKAVCIEHYEAKSRRQIQGIHCITIMILANDGTVFAVDQSKDMLEPLVEFLHCRFHDKIEEGYRDMNHFENSNFARLIE